MRQQLTNLLRNLAAGLRLVLFLRVSRLAFRIDLIQLLLLFAVSAGIDMGIDWLRFGDGGQFSWFGLGNEFFGAGVLLLTAALLALAFREPNLVLTLPVLVLSGFPLLQVLRVIPTFVYDDAPKWQLLWAAFDGLMIGWAFLLSARSVAMALSATRSFRWLRALAGGLVLIAPIWFAPSIAPNDTWWKDASSNAGVDPRYPNPASEPVLTTQRHLLDEALSALADERPNVTDLYFVGFAGDARTRWLRHPRRAVGRAGAGQDGRRR